MSDKKTYKVTKSKSSTKKTENKKSSKKETAVKEDRLSMIIHQIMPFILGLIAVFCAFCLISPSLTGIIGKALRGLFFGLFGSGAIAIPFLILLVAFMWRKNVKKEKLTGFIICTAMFFICLTVILHIWTNGSHTLRFFNIPKPDKNTPRIWQFGKCIEWFWDDGQVLKGGGVIGGFIACLLRNFMGDIGANILGISGMVFFGLFMFGLTPYHVWLYFKYFLHEKSEKRRERMLAEDDEPVNTFKAKPTVDDTEENTVHSRVKRDPVDRHRFEPDIEVDDSTADKEKGVQIIEADSEDDVPPFDIDGKRVEVIAPVNKSHGKVSKLPDLPVNSGETGEKTDLSEIFSDSDGVDVLQRFADEQKAKALQRASEDNTEGTDAELEISRSQVVGDGAQEEIKEYEFPPISLMKLDTSPKNVDISGELHENATKLVETLRSFKVRTKIVNVSRGPTITRYELQPEEGVRVRSISNLVDDIALNLATSGVRIEAPIPGKAAVGVEVPNKTVSTVFLRDLVDTDSFRKATSKLNVSLGVDVAGDPIFLDIAKMPHLLIAGATGMGKSVCINSLITSLLYKATPEEVKLILIDPKKVEFNLYNGLPHLLVPVVSDPKKAAGSLQWAVTEMERRFVMIEEVGVRDVKNYNSVTKDDPEKEFLPQIVIIIDELADLMMTAPDDVETSICRLAQKARAAGMHLVIGTQRPSVDVITGLIKANIPSRIAFTVSSQTDSRVILDISGAEKLIGRGDMLYAPIGASKPIRVQGAFVSESEVESIVEYIREHNGDTEYSSDIVESINRAAASCGNGKKGSAAAISGDIDGEGSGMADPMLRPAIELAIESGKISTSLIQRRLSLGYGRAAKLIDEMQIRGFVSPPEGQKPRTVLITKEQYMEMILDRKEDLG